MLSFFLTREYSEGNNDMLRTKRNELSLIWLKQGQALELRNFSYINLQWRSKFVFRMYFFVNVRSILLVLFRGSIESRRRLHLELQLDSMFRSKPLIYIYVAWCVSYVVEIIALLYIQYVIHYRTPTPTPLQCVLHMAVYIYIYIKSSYYYYYY